ncbi:MAG: YbhB/YbcL family Raf kinase inhibitor-like protein [Proteobacteria bacterium]|nr:YbhB/YbcL family Raf kinase inhibitor-like protein [Pseudomonadota bacterium]
MRRIVIAILAAVIVCGCDEDEDYPEFSVTSAAFGQGETIPIRHTCDGDNISPPLSFKDTPDGTQFYAVIMDDPDAPIKTWIHWLIWGISASTNMLVEDQHKYAKKGVNQGVNTDEGIGYSGPCPPAGAEHRYFFKVYALEKNLALKEGASKEQLIDAMDGHIIGKGELMGLYKR